MADEKQTCITLSTKMNVQSNTHDHKKRARLCKNAQKNGITKQIDVKNSKKVRLGLIIHIHQPSSMSVIRNQTNVNKVMSDILPSIKQHSFSRSAFIQASIYTHNSNSTASPSFM